MSSIRHPLTVRRTLATLTGLASILVLVAVTALSIGSVSIPFGRIVEGVVGLAVLSDVEKTILWDIRLPRVLLAMVVGAGLSVAGAVFQALLRNPLAEPYILGVSSGGTVGSILAIGFLAAFHPYLTPLASFAGSALVMFAVYLIGHRRGQLDTNTLLLGGVMIGAFFNAAILLVVAVFNTELRNAYLWLMGNLSGAHMDAIVIIGPTVFLTSALLFLKGRDFNLIAVGEENALQLGVDVKYVKRFSYVAASLLTGVVVSVSGVIGFVGLIIPHICRMLFGPDNRLLLPASFLTGAAFLILADILARTLLSPTEIPVGAVTAALGAPVFVYLLRKV